MADWSRLVPILPQGGPRKITLYRALRGSIESGALPPGSKLPTTRDLAQRLNVSRGAAVAAFDMLIADGFAEARTGAGTFVARSVPNLKGVLPPTASIESPAPLLPGTLGVAWPDERTLKSLRILLSRHLLRPSPEHFSYGDPRGTTALREAIAAYLRSARGLRCSSSSIIITAGILQGLNLILRAIAGRGDTVAMEDPGYPKALGTFRAAGLRVIGVPVDAQGLDAGRCEDLPAETRALYVTPSHQFPLGVSMTMARRLQLIDWAKRRGAWVIEDDYDSELRFSGPPLAALQGIDEAGRVIYLGTFAKVLFPGIRVGYAVLPEALIEPVLTLRRLTDRQPPSLLEGALADFVQQGHFAAHLRRARKRAQAARDGLVAGLQTCADIRAMAPQQGLHLIARLTSGMDDVTAVKLAAQAGLGALPLSSTYIDHAPEQGLIIGFSGFSQDTLYRSAERLGQLLQSHV